GFTAQSRIYDGTAAATVLTRSLSGTVSGDDVALSGGTASFADKNVGTAKTVTLVGASLAGSDAPNYHLTGVATTPADITARTLHVSAVSDSKTYDGTTSSGATPTTSGLQTGDTVTGLAEAFASKNVLGAGGSTLVVTAYTVNDGNSGNNYSVSLHTASGTISPATLDISASPDSRTYDGTSYSLASIS